MYSLNAMIVLLQYWLCCALCKYSMHNLHMHKYAVCNLHMRLHNIQYALVMYAMHMHLHMHYAVCICTYAV